jgi:hypothetical protein
VSEGVQKMTSITIYGNKVFFQAVRRALNTLNKTKLGRRLINALEDKKFTIQPPAMSAIVREENVQFYATNSAGGAISFDPVDTFIGEATQVKKELWRQRNPTVGLYHELLHIYYKFNPLTVTSISGKVHTKIVGSGHVIDESLITGIDCYDDNNNRYNFSGKEFIQANGGLMISENAFRRDYAPMRGHKNYYIRPYYDKPDARVTPKQFKF